ncbi:MAG: ribosome-binding factor A [Rickettsiales bacterium]|jgi:ribosome-binding factor A|nr:ribosome-binding factor A [Rickettsiales bacterium]
MKEKSVLQLRLQKQIQHLLQDMFLKSDFSYKEKKFFITMANVDISPDLRNLKLLIEVSDLDLKIKNEVVKRLNKESVFAVKKMLAEKMNLRYVPDVFFLLDKGNEKIIKISEIIEKEKSKIK